MITTIEIKETNIQASDVYSSESYDSSGFYINIDETNTQTVILVNKSINSVLYLGVSLEELGVYATTELKEDIIENKTVSESFALKAIAVAIRGDMVNFKDIE